MKDALAEDSNVEEIEEIILEHAPKPIDQARALARWHQEKLEAIIYADLREDFGNFDEGGV